MAFLPIGEKLPRGQLSPIAVDGDIVRIGLGRGLETIVDIGDLHVVEGIRWLPFIAHTGHIYAYRRTKERALHLLHRILLSPDDDSHVDHGDGDGLNNRRENISICTPAQNLANSIGQHKRRLELKGAYEVKRRSGEYTGRFESQIKYNGGRIRLGVYATMEEAAAAYAGAAKVLYGKFAKA